MAGYNKYQKAIKDAFTKKHNFETDAFKIVLSNTAPDAAADNVLADASEIAAGNGYTAGGSAVVIASADQVAGVLSVVQGGDVTFTAAGGTVGPFRYAIFINSTADLLVSYWDRGSSLTLNDGEDFTVQFGANIFQAT